MYVTTERSPAYTGAKYTAPQKHRLSNCKPRHATAASTPRTPEVLCLGLESSRVDNLVERPQSIRMSSAVVHVSMPVCSTPVLGHRARSDRTNMVSCISFLYVLPQQFMMTTQHCPTHLPCTTCDWDLCMATLPSPMHVHVFAREICAVEVDSRRPTILRWPWNPWHASGWG